MQPLSPGLRDIEVLESRITAITPAGLRLRGRPLADLLVGLTCEEVAWLLWHGQLPTAAELAGLRRSLARAWLFASPTSPDLEALLAGLRDAEPLAALQVALPILGLAQRSTVPAEQAVRLLAEVPAVLACHRLGRPADPLEISQPLAQQILVALGADPHVLTPAAADQALILFADHELPASTFAARIAVAAQAGLYDGMSAAVAVLKGPLHGGGLREAADLLAELAAADDLDEAAARVAAGGRVVGFGHSVYRAGDPRVAPFLELARASPGPWLRAATALLAAVAAAGGPPPNVDLAAAVWMHSVGLAPAMMPAIFAVARTAGWTAHMREQQSDNRLIRPRARYVGDEHA